MLKLDIYWLKWYFKKNMKLQLNSQLNSQLIRCYDSANTQQDAHHKYSMNFWGLISVNPYLWIVHKKSTKWEYGEASFVDNKSTYFLFENLKSIFLPSKTIQQKFFWFFSGFSGTYVFSHDISG